MKFNYTKLKGRIYEKFGRTSNLAKELKFSRQRISYILNKTNGLSSKVIIKLSKVLEIKKDEIVDYFFNVEEE